MVMKREESFTYLSPFFFIIFRKELEDALGRCFFGYLSIYLLFVFFLLVLSRSGLSVSISIEWAML